MPTDLDLPADLCHGLIARRVERPLLDAREDGGSADTALSGIDVDRLDRVAGFVTKVRHNPVRFVLPITLRALTVTGLENDFFTSYAPAFTLARSEGLSDDDRTRRFAEALRRWLDPDLDDHRLVAGVLAHERTLAELAGAAPLQPPSSDVHVDPRSRPVLRTEIRSVHLDVDPSRVADVAAGRGGLLDLDRTPRCYLYLPTPAGTKVKQVDPAAATVLELADGRRRIEELARLIGGGETTLVEFYIDAAHRGLVDVWS